jgi:hypothetical protein
MKIINVAFVIPIYPPHYDFIYNLLNKCTNNDIEVDIFLVFSNNKDYDSFTMKNKIHPIICDSLMTNSIITYKKFFGLKHLANSKYDYIICCDSEIDIICDNFTNQIINNKIDNIFTNKKIYAGHTEDSMILTITQMSANIFPDKIELLKDVTKDYKLYFWWSDLPVYRRDHIIPFFNVINYENITWYHFDYIIYQYYLILYHGFEIINTTPITNVKWSLEKLSTSDIDVLNKLVDINYGFSWNSKKMYEINKNFIDSQKGFLIYHLDR